MKNANEYKKRKLNKIVNKMICSIEREKNIQTKYKKIYKCASYIYYYNLEYNSDRLENSIFEISKSYMNFEYTDNNVFLFFDSFGLSYRGLINQYIDSFITNKMKFIYVTYETNTLNDSIKKKIKENAVDFYLIKNDISSIERLKDISSHCSSVIFYIKPSDINALILSYAYKGKKYLINLTDHAFWLGNKSMDYYIEFREYGANISYYKRGICKSKLLLQPYYPIINNVQFRGYPLKNMNKSNVIFSGGALYKTIDKSLMYYEMIEKILNDNPNYYFWYAGSGDSKYLDILINKFSGRIVHTNERDDLYEVLKNVKLYISTYPMIGGLMSQYCAAAGVPCLTLLFDECSSGVLLKSGFDAFEYTHIEELLLDCNRLLNDEDYYKKRCSNDLIITKEIFDLNLKNILFENKSKFVLSINEEYDTTRFINTYLERDSIISIYKNIFDKNGAFMKDFWYYFPVVFLKLFKRRH